MFIVTEYAALNAKAIEYHLRNSNCLLTGKHKDFITVGRGVPYM